MFPSLNHHRSYGRPCTSLVLICMDVQLLYITVFSFVVALSRFINVCGITNRVEPSLSHKDQKERAQRSEFVQGLVLSTIFDEALWEGSMLFLSTGSGTARGKHERVRWLYNSSQVTEFYPSTCISKSSDEEVQNASNCITTYVRLVLVSEKTMFCRLNDCTISYFSWPKAYSWLKIAY